MVEYWRFSRVERKFVDGVILSERQISGGCVCGKDLKRKKTDKLYKIACNMQEENFIEKKTEPNPCQAGGGGVLT